MPNKKIEVTRRGSFFRDPCFMDSWPAIEKQKHCLQAECPAGITIKSPFSMNDYLSSIADGGEMSGAESQHYKVVLDVAHFKPSELIVTCKDHCIIVQGSHDEQQDSGTTTHGHGSTISRSFVRKYPLPTHAMESLDYNGIQCDLSSDGVLVVTIPKQQQHKHLNGKTELDHDNNVISNGSCKDSAAKKLKVSLSPTPYFCSLPDFHLVPFWERSHGRADNLLGLQSDSNWFKVLIDVKEFSPDELNVSCSDYYLIISGCHDEKEDPNVGGGFSRSFIRKYDLPKSVDANELEANLSSNGILQIKGRKHAVAAIEAEAQRKIDIKHNTA